MKRLGRLLAIACIFQSSFPQIAMAQESTLDTVTWQPSRLLRAPDSVRLFQKAHQQLRLARQTAETSDTGQALSGLSEYHHTYGNLDSAFYYANRTIAHYEEHAQPLALADAYLQLMALHDEKAEYALALQLVYKALAIYEETQDKRGIARSYIQICNLLYYEQRYSEGVTYCDKAISILEREEDTLSLALGYRFKAANQLFSGDSLEDALASANQSIALYDKLNEKGLPYMAAVNWKGNILKYMERFDEAIATYQANYERSKESGMDRYLISSLANMGHVYLIQKRYAEALPYNLEAISIMEATGKTKNLWENYMHVSDIYEAMGNYPKALEYYQMYANKYAEFQQTIIDRLEAETHAKYEAGQRGAQIVLQDETIDRQRRTQLLYISVAALLIIIVAGMYFTLKNIRKKRKTLALLNAELDSKNTQNELLLKEIHHRVKNNLELVKSLIALQSAQVSDPSSKEALQSSQNRVQSMGILHQKLYQGNKLGSVEMKDYFINLSEGVLDTFGAEDRIHIECAMDRLELDVDTAVPIGLIVNELLTNSLKYGFPEQAKGIIIIELAQQADKTLTLQVQDNGIGKPVGSAPKGTGFGTQLIQLLTQQLNGSIVESASEGHTVTFQFNLTPAA
ncbi:MAG: histidine kinase [Flavobacteriaceae bacterium]|nr:histidine kinase [Flavobacteriaceae bacterium]